MASLFARGMVAHELGTSLNHALLNEKYTSCFCDGMLLQYTVEGMIYHSNVYWEMSRSLQVSRITIFRMHPFPSLHPCIFFFLLIPTIQEA